MNFKKCVILTFFAVILMTFVTNSVLAANIYSCAGSLGDAMIDEKIPNMVSTIVTVIKIVVPILLVIFGMLDLAKGLIAQKEDEIKKGQQIFIKRLISGALVFFVFILVQLIISFVADDNDEANIMTCAQCFINGDCTYMKKSDGSCPSGTKLSDNKKFCIK